MAASSIALGERMVTSGLLMGLVLVLANKRHPESQRQAAGLLYFLVEKIPIVEENIKEALGSTFFDFFCNKPDTFYREINRDQLRYLKRNAFRLRRTGKLVGNLSGATREEMPMNPTHSSSEMSSRLFSGSVTAESNETDRYE